MDLSLIVCAVDFNASGEAALARALALARWHEAELHVLYIRPGRARWNASTVTSAEDPLVGQLVAFISSSNPERIAFTPVVLTGDPAKAVAEYARVRSAGLVVVGQNARRGSRFWSSGVLATDVARAVPCPTLTVSQKGSADRDVAPSFNNILCGIDFSAASLAALSEALTMAQESGGRITLLHVLEGFPSETVYSGSPASRLITEYRARVDRVERELRTLVSEDALNWCEVETEVVSGIPHDAIMSVAMARKTDLVVIGLPRRTRLERIVMASTVAGVLRRARCPVLAVPAPSAISTMASEVVGADRDDENTIAPLTLAATHRLASGKRRQDTEALR